MEEHQAGFQSYSKKSVNTLSDFAAGCNMRSAPLWRSSKRIPCASSSDFSIAARNPYTMKRQAIPVHVIDEPRITRKANPYN